MRKKVILFLLPLFSVLGLAAAGVFYTFGYSHFGTVVLQLVIIVGGVFLSYKMVREILRKHFVVDIIAIAAIVASFALKEYWAGVVLVIMMSGGEALEDYALTRAKQRLTALLSRAPSIAHKKDGEILEDVGVAAVKKGDVIFIKPGEIIPVDGIVTDGTSQVDESAVTGESVPVHKKIHSLVVSGTVNEQSVLVVRAQQSASESQYEQIVKMVKAAANSKAPIMRLADRYAVFFTFITFAITLVTWLTTHNPVLLLAVLVVATPCPLILATPIAIMSGISWAASRGIIVKSGGTLEILGEAQSFVFDKTGTLTVGSPKVVGAHSSVFSPEEFLYVAASVDQFSAHIFARSLVAHVHSKYSKELLLPEDFKEVLGDGVSGKLDGRKYIFGKFSFLKLQGVEFTKKDRDEYNELQNRGIIPVYLAEHKKLLGRVEFADTVRPEIKSVFHSIRSLGIKHIEMLTGDRKAVAQRIAGELGITEFQAEVLPGQKLQAIAKLQKQSPPVVMVGDGINDAPSLAAADVGIAMGAAGLTAASEAADMVITVNSMERLSESLYIAKRVLHVARQGMFAGIGVSIVLMLIASFGYIPPVYGAMVQELLDVIVILNALRVNFSH